MPLACAWTGRAPRGGEGRASGRRGRAGPCPARAAALPRIPLAKSFPLTPAGEAEGRGEPPTGSPRRRAAATRRGAALGDPPRAWGCWGWQPAERRCPLPLGLRVGFRSPPLLPRPFSVPKKPVISDGNPGCEIPFAAERAELAPGRGGGRDVCVCRGLFPARSCCKVR